jgi:amino acid transporter
MQDEIEAQRALREERSRVNGILEKRPVRMGKGFWAMLWSFIVVVHDEKGA